VPPEGLALSELLTGPLLSRATRIAATRMLQTFGHKVGTAASAAADSTRPRPGQGLLGDRIAGECKPYVACPCYSDSLDAYLDRGARIGRDINRLRRAK